MRKFSEFQTRFQKVSVWKSGVATEFRVTGAIHAAYHQDRFLTGLAWDLIAAGALMRPSGNPRSILMLGVAGGTTLHTLRHLLPEVELTGIDLDEELIALAFQEMALAGTGTEIIFADAYEWMKTNTRTFDVIIDDLYLAGESDVFRDGKCDRNWLALVKKSLAPGGLLALNLVTGPGHRTKQIATRKNLIAHFSAVHSLTTQDSLNEILVAGENIAPATRLMDFTECFSDVCDRIFWKRIKIRKLK